MSIDPHNQQFEKPLIATYMGHLVNPLDLKPEDIDPLDVAHSLAMQVRYTGHVDKRMSVAEHCVLIHDYLHEIGEPVQTCKDGLFHDTNETYLVDLPAPIKHAINGFGEAFKAAAKKIDVAVAERFGLSVPEPKIVKEIDVQFRQIELFYLFPRLPKEKRDQYNYGDLLPIKLRNWSEVEAKFEFLCRMEGHGIVKRDAHGDWVAT